MAQSSFDVSSSSVNETPKDKQDPKETASRLAAYTGFTDLADLRRFLVSRPMLEVTTEILTDRTLANVTWDDMAPPFGSCLCLGGVNSLEQKYGEIINLGMHFLTSTTPNGPLK
jgi:hypothetical protein